MPGERKSLSVCSCALYASGAHGGRGCAFAREFDEKGAFFFFSRTWGSSEGERRLAWDGVGSEPGWPVTCPPRVAGCETAPAVMFR